ncbi:cation efflux family protein [Striga asiatica]|uniref:Cation efflux family protein n=1 Tax=Striga asiatica TaxID=4170 RepID=A0A5A7P8U3_STRAF|nr:cation efflux family protein [Striga asiatica]
MVEIRPSGRSCVLWSATLSTTLISFETLGIWTRFLFLSKVLCDFLRNMTHIDRIPRIRTINAPTDMPIRTHSFIPPYFFDSAVFRLPEDMLHKLESEGKTLLRLIEIKQQLNQCQNVTSYYLLPQDTKTYSVL